MKRHRGAAPSVCLSFIAPIWQATAGRSYATRRPSRRATWKATRPIPLRAAAWIQHEVAQRLFTIAGLGVLDRAIDQAGKRGFHATELNVRSKGHIESAVRHYASSNVVGRVPGAVASHAAAPGAASTPPQPHQAVLYTAHYDHLGIDPLANGDRIYNGAADNGTGCGILLELARAFAQSTMQPASCCLLFLRYRRRAGPPRLAISRNAPAGTSA